MIIEASYIRNNSVLQFKIVSIEPIYEQDVLEYQNMCGFNPYTYEIKKLEMHKDPVLFRNVTTWECEEV